MDTKVDTTDTRKQHASNISKRPKFIPAPIPTTNPWNNNRGQKANEVNRVAPPQTNNVTHQRDQPQTSFNTLVSEFQMVNQLIDLDKMIRLVRELNLELTNSTNELEKFVKFNKFCQTHFMANESQNNRCLP